MNPIDSQLELARRRTKDAFQVLVEPLWLIKPPSSEPEEDSIHFKTRMKRNPLGSSPPGRLGADWRAVPLEKREGNPFPERISVGRAKNCDVVLRFAGVSKLHAHIFLEPDETVSIVDLRSVNGTAVNGERVLPGARRKLNPGDWLSLGEVDVMFADAGLFYDVLNTAVA